MIEAVIPSPQVNKAHLEYEKEIAYIEKWQNELIRIVLKWNTPQDKEYYKQATLQNANYWGWTPLEELRQDLNSKLHKQEYERFKCMTNF